MVLQGVLQYKRAASKHDLRYARLPLRASSLGDWIVLGLSDDSHPLQYRLECILGA